MERVRTCRARSTSGRTGGSPAEAPRAARARPARPPGGGGDGGGADGPRRQTRGAGRGTASRPVGSRRAHRGAAAVARADQRLARGARRARRRVRADRRPARPGPDHRAARAPRPEARGAASTPTATSTTSAASVRSSTASRAATTIEVRIHDDDKHMLLDPLGTSGMFGAYLEGLDLRPPEVVYGMDDGEQVRGAGMTFTAIHTPGHTRGSVCFTPRDRRRAAHPVLRRPPLRGLDRSDRPARRVLRPAHAVDGRQDPADGRRDRRAAGPRRHHHRRARADDQPVPRRAPPARRHLRSRPPTRRDTCACCSFPTCTTPCASSTGSPSAPRVRRSSSSPATSSTSARSCPWRRRSRWSSSSSRGSGSRPW